MADLTGTTPADTYKGLLQVNDYTNGVDATAKYIQDGEGTDSSLAISTDNVGIGTSSPQSELHIESNVANHDTTLKIENRQGDTGGTAIEFQGYRDIDNDHWVAKIVADHVNSTVHGSLAMGSNLEFYTWDGSAASIASPKMTIDQSGNVGVGTNSPSAPLHIVDTGTADMIFLESTDDGDLNSPDFNLYRNSASPAADDKIGVLKFSGNSSSGSATGYAHIEGTIVNPTNLKSKLAFKIRSDGALESRMEVGPDKVEVNSTTGGVIMPRMTTIQRTAVSAVDGEMVYDTDLNTFYGYANGAWTALH